MKRTIWTEDRWRAYIGGLCEIRRILWEFVFELPESRGLRADHHLKPFCRAHTFLVASMMNLETMIESHIGGEDITGPTLSFCQGRNRNGTGRDRSDCAIVFAKGRSKPGLPVLPRNEWIAWGTKAVRAHGLLGSAMCEVCNAKGIQLRGRHLANLEKTERALDKARCRLDSLVISQHPDWGDAIRVFYGADATLEPTQCE